MALLFRAWAKRLVTAKCRAVALEFADELDEGSYGHWHDYQTLEQVIEDFWLYCQLARNVEKLA